MLDGFRNSLNETGWEKGSCERAIDGWVSVFDYAIYADCPLFGFIRKTR